MLQVELGSNTYRKKLHKIHPHVSPTCVKFTFLTPLPESLCGTSKQMVYEASSAHVNAPVPGAALLQLGRVRFWEFSECFCNDGGGFTLCVAGYLIGCIKFGLLYINTLKDDFNVQNRFLSGGQISKFGNL